MTSVRPSDIAMDKDDVIEGVFKEQRKKKILVSQFLILNKTNKIQFFNRVTRPRRRARTSA